MAQVFTSDNIALTKDVFYPIYMNENKSGVILEVGQDQISKKTHNLFLEVSYCQKDNLIGSIEVTYLNSNGQPSSDVFKPETPLIPLEPGDDTKMIQIKITKDFSDEEVFLKVRLRKILINHTKLAEHEQGVGQLITEIEDMSQKSDGKEDFQKFVDMPINKLESGQAYRLANID